MFELRRVSLGAILFGAAVVAFGALGTNNLAAAGARNLGFIELSRAISSSPDDCRQLTFEASLPQLQSAMARQPGDATAWAAVLRLKGMTDRKWIIDRFRERDLKLSEVERLAIGTAKTMLMPVPWAARSKWNYSRCQSAWDAWTLGLINATNGDWERAVAAYQAGIGLALGRVPDDIIKEYYAALADYYLSQSGAVPDRELAAGKFLALGGAGERAAGLLRSLATDSRLMPGRRCEAEGWLTWMQDADSEGIPPWPIAVSDGQCVDAPQSGESPEWRLSPNQALADANHGMTLIGIDVDPDVLEAGAEVIGTLYWRLPDASVKEQRFRQPNLWPNSGNSWLPFGDVWACLPGYIEPSWVADCASRVETLSSSEGALKPFGRLTEPQGELPDANLTTASLPVPRDRFIVYAGRWRIDGDFPGPHVARMVFAAPDRYEVVMGMPDGKPSQWREKVVAAQPESANMEIEQWLRPRSGRGSGELWFDDVFSFVLPEFIK